MRAELTLIFSLLLILLPLTTQTLTALQTSDDALPRFQTERKSEPVAAVLEAMIPVLGHVYAEDAWRELKPLAVTASGIALTDPGSTVGHREEVFRSSIQEGATALKWLGIPTYLGGRRWGIVSAISTAQELNAYLREPIKFSVRSADTSGHRCCGALRNWVLSQWESTHIEPQRVVLRWKDPV